MIEKQSGIKDFQTGLKNKLVLVTGASRGIGFAIARAFAEQGCRLVIQSRNAENLAMAESKLKDLGGSILAQVVDVMNENAVISSIHSINKALGSIDVLVNNAGIYKTAAVEGHPTQTWDETINANLKGPFIYSREVLPQMKQSNWGRIINISSISGKQGEVHGAAYSASKFGLIGLTQSLALELASAGVTVNAICPGWVKTDMSVQQLSDPEWCKLNGVDPEESLDMARLSIPQMQFVRAEEVAELAVYLASESGRGITGQAINICGGMCLS